MKLEFEWDLSKATANALKHGVTFEEAATIFEAEKILVKDDMKHSLAEKRRIALSSSNQNRFLVVSYTERAGRIRIISARRASRKEITQYEQKTGK